MEIAAAYSFVRVINEKRQGLFYARNRGFKLAKGDLLARIDADTCIKPAWVAEAIELGAEYPKIGGFSGPCEFYAPLGTTFWYWLHRVVYFWSTYLLYRHQTLFGSNMIIRKSAWQKINNQVCERSDIHEDMDVTWHLVDNGYKVIFTKRLLASISLRAFKYGIRYPRMWTRTYLQHRRMSHHEK